jgi:hypothetical protein
MGKVVFPRWAEEMRQIFRAETISQFIIHGNTFDLVAHRDDDRFTFHSLDDYLAQVLFAPFDVVLTYDRGQGIGVPKGAEHFESFLTVLDKFHGTRFSSDAGIEKDGEQALALPGLLPRAPLQALEIIDRFVNGVVAMARNPAAKGPRSAAVILNYAQFLVPRGESLCLSGEIGSHLIRILRWAEDPSITSAAVVTCLVSENLLDLNEQVVNSSYSAKIRVGLPDCAEIQEYVGSLAKEEKDFARLCEVDVPTLATKLVGLNRVNVKNILLRGLRNSQPITAKYLSQLRKETIEKEATGKLEFYESRRTLDDVAGHVEAKRWLREDAELIRKGTLSAIPMGYLITGRIGTGKTYLVQCFAGECGIPFVEMKNFREKWVGATEGNLEKIFTILHALGQVVVFVDEADQATGRRGGDGSDDGLSGRVYGMLAKEMANTENRGKIIWIFATSRPDMVEVDLKRQGRLDVHIPLFPPVDEQGRQELFLAMARKLRLDLTAGQLPALPYKGVVGGNEMEGLLVRAVREFELQTPAARKPLPEVLARVVAEFKPSAHTAAMELMDLLAVKECTDQRFLPERYARLDAAEVDSRIDKLMAQLRL